MQTSIGKTTKSFFIKILVGIIILPFVFWGMGDVFRGGNQNIVATIESEKISTQEFTNYLSRLNLSDSERKNINKTKLLDQILKEYIGRKVIELEIKDMGINISDASLKRIIVNDENFYKNGKFSRIEYEKFLLKNSLSAPSFENNIIEQEKKMQLLNFLSSGTVIPNFYIEKEFKKENQTKFIRYINLKDFYKNKKGTKEQFEKIYKENKNIFIEKFKSFSYSELTPEILVGKKEYEKNFFSKIDLIENNIIYGVLSDEITKNYNLKLINVKNVNKSKINTEGTTLNIEDQLFKKIFSIREVNAGEIVKLKNKYFLIQVNSIENKQRKINDKRVQEVINLQIDIQNKLETNTKIVKEISSGAFSQKKMKEFATKNNLKLQNIKISSLKDNTIFTENLIKKIFLFGDNQVNLITDSKLMNNFIIYTDKTEYEKFDTTSDKFKIYKAKAKLNFAKEIYKRYDDSINNKYNIEINGKVIDRIKNSF